jgi:hypothetical protein
MALTDEQVGEVIAEYDRIVRRNWTEFHDTLLAVATDDTGEVIHEVVGMAMSAGHYVTDADFDRLHLATTVYRALLRSELAAVV